MRILVLNAGSSSLKFQVISTSLEQIEQDSDERICTGGIERFGNTAEFILRQNTREEKQTRPVSDVKAGVHAVLERLGDDPPDAVGHRVVHGGEHFSQSALIDDAVLSAVRDCITLAPLHNPSNLDGIEAIRERFGTDLPQVAVFDTAFHQSMPEHAYFYALPYDLYRKHGVRRYGFHGTSHRYVAHRYRQVQSLTREQTNIITLHLGNGCSAAAIKHGRCVDTSMGMTPLEGLVMGTRAGDIDPSLVRFISERENISTAEVDSLLNHRSGLLGISGISNDMRELQNSADPQARLAITIFCYRVRKYIGAYLSAMNGTDAIIFTGGIGEHAPPIRAEICNGLSWAGLTLDMSANDANATTISTGDSTLRAFRIPTDEELLIARDTVRCILKVPHPS